MTHISAFAIIPNAEGKVLLCYRTDKDLWNLPGGGANEGEAPWEVVIREVCEESGLEVVMSKLTGIYYKPSHQELSFAFLCQIIGGVSTLSSEADKIEWFDLSHLPFNTSIRQMQRIKAALNSEQITMEIQ